MNIKEQSTLQETNFGVIAEFVSNTKESLQLRPTIQLLIDQGQADALLSLGFPKDCIPVMQLWRKRGPDILTSFSHPEELDIDKITALVNLGLYTTYTFGEAKPNVFVMDYDTIPIQKSVKKPFKSSSFGLDFDLFGVKNDRMSATKLTDERVEKIRENISNLSSIDRGSLSENILNQIRADLVNALKNSELAIRRSEATTNIQKLIAQRLGEIGIILDESVSQRPKSVGQLLSQFNQGLVAYLFGESDLIKPQGFKSTLFSENSEFLNLIKQTINMLIQSRGVDFLRSFINPGEALCMQGTSTDRYILTKDDNDSYQLKSNTDAFRISPGEAEEFIANSVPLAKMESIALFSGAQTLHMGSEYGIRPKILKELGFCDAAFDYVMGLKISADKKHGNMGIVMGEGGYVPSTLAYVALGRNGLRNLILAQAGRTTEPVQLTVPELKKQMTDSLLQEYLKIT